MMTLFSGIKAKIKYFYLKLSSLLLSILVLFVACDKKHKIEIDKLENITIQLGPELSNNGTDSIYLRVKSKEEPRSMTIYLKEEALIRVIKACENQYIQPYKLTKSYSNTFLIIVDNKKQHFAFDSTLNKNTLSVLMFILKEIENHKFEYEDSKKYYLQYLKEKIRKLKIALSNK